MDETLLDIQIRRDSLLTKIMENHGEITPEIELELNQIDFAQTSKIESYCNLLDRLENEITFWKEKQNRIKTLTQRLQQTIDNLKERLKGFMISNGHKTISGTETQITCYNSKPRVLIDDDCDMTKVPFEFIRTKLEIDKEAVRKALEEGKKLPFARLEQTKALRMTEQVPHSRWLAKDKP